MRLFPRVISESEAPYDGGRVRILPPEVAHRIAAGEVIERPASAVKELVENALDAGATRVEVEIEGGGIRLVRVRDDGSGMSAQDARRSVGRHATSKISSAEDLARVLSLGFRGEALHAISSVSALTLTTGQRGALPGTSGTRVRLFAGGPAEVSSASHPAGTTVEARDLFLNLPVRRGFLGTERAEANAVATVVEALALSRPHVGFFLRSEGQGLLALPAAADLRERVAQVHGLALARSLVPLDGEPVWGLVSPISVSFPTRRYLHVAVNGRVVERDSFAPAVAKAYADLLPKGRHPAAFLRLELGPGEVDVNVHPAKSAVRLRGGRSAYPLVVGAIRTALSLEKEGKGAPTAGPDAGLRLVGQFAGRCILAEEGDDLLIIDQHGAHERVLYEKLLKNLRGTPAALPSPVVVRLPSDLAPEAWNFEAELEALGFGLEPFGGDAVRLLAAPRAVMDPEGAFLGAVEALAGGEDLAKALACRGSTKFGEELSREALGTLLEEWAACEFRMVCPHGRPIVKRVGLADLLREFGRA
jgi:DNA mismatch repair protein MutL